MLLNSLIYEDSLWSLLARFAIDLVVLFILLRFIYYKFSRKGRFFFSFFLMGIMIFLVVSLLEMVEIKMGMALGLFAIFSILRFRTRNMTVKDMTYIFTVIGISVINSQAVVSPPILGMIVVNLIILLSVYFLELFLKKRAITSLTIIYKKLELLTPDNKKELLKDLSRQIGQNIEKVEIQRINLQRKRASIVVFFKDNTIN